MTDAIKDLVESLLKNAMVSFDTMANNACDKLQNGVSDSLWNTVSHLTGVFTPFCNIIIGICILLELANIASKVDLIKWEHGLKCGVKICLAKVCIEIAPTFLRACYNQCVLFIGAMGLSSGTVSLSGTVTPQISTALDEVTSLGGAIGLLCSTLILIMGIKICGLLVMVMTYGRIFEILVYLMVSPIPVAFACYNEGHDGIARITMKFIKGFIAVCLSGVMMYMCICIFGTIVNTAFTTLVTESAGASTGSALVSDLCYDMILFTIVLVMAVAKCGGWAKQIMDA